MRIEKLHWKNTLAIRQAVLWPDKPQEYCHVDGDDAAWHYGVFINDALVCVASVYPDINFNLDIKSNSKQSARLRKFATLAEYQKQGIGSFVLSHIIESLKTQNIHHFWCDARESAIEFYRQFGFETVGARFYKAEIPYFKMQMHID